MKLLGYGEDALTLWALTNKTSYIYKHLKGEIPPSECIAFYRSSFGRRG